MKKSDIGDVVEVVIILVILVVGFFYTIHGLAGGDSVSGSYNRYYETHEEF